MSEVYEKLMKCYKSVREKTDFVPEAALILGSGLGDYADDLKIEASINYADIEGFPVSTVEQISRQISRSRLVIRSDKRNRHAL